MKKALVPKLSKLKFFLRNAIIILFKLSAVILILISLIVLIYVFDDYNKLINLDSDDGVLIQESMTSYQGELQSTFSGYSGKFVNGKKDGEHRIYDGWHFLGLGGNLIRLEYYTYGVRNGKWKRWSDEGLLMSEYTYKNGNLIGLEEHWNTYGELIHINYNESEIVNWVTDYLRTSSNLHPIEGIYLATWGDGLTTKYGFIKHRSQLIAVTLEPYQSHQINNERYQYRVGDVKFSLKQQGSDFIGTYFYTEHDYYNVIYVGRSVNSKIIDYDSTSVTWASGAKWQKLK
jgi:hypothetical protein